MPKIYTPDDVDKVLAHNLELVSASKFDMNNDMLDLAQQLSRIHGRLRATNEKHGLHFYMACPSCLREYGEDELYKMHLAVNVEKYFGSNADNCGFCMKESVPYRITDLLSMPPLSERGYNVKPQIIKVPKINMDFLEQDSSGAWVPKGPGMITPVYQLPTDHPAQQYLAYRGFDAEKLWHQFRLSYCEQERSDAYHRRLLNGFRATPQGRIVFFIDMDGICRGWQARILDYEQNDIRYYFHPYKKEWVPVLKKQGNKWVPIADKWSGWDDVKYVIGAGCRRNSCLMGYDAAVAWNIKNQARYPGESSWCVLSEGPLDGGRIGPPGMATMGKAFSEEQCRLVCSKFQRVIYVRDVDKAGEEAAASVEDRFRNSSMPAKPELKIVCPPHGKDLGAMGQEEAEQFIWKVLQEI